MDENSLQLQINELNAKLDRVLECVVEQKEKASQMNDLVADLSIVGKDIYDTAVYELDHNSIPMDPDEIKKLLFNFLKNIHNFNSLMQTLESFMDFTRDAAPIANEVIIDFTKKLDEYNRRGYFKFLKESGKIIDKVVTHYSCEDVNSLAENVIMILETFKNLTQPQILNSMNNAVKVFGNLDFEHIPEYSLWKTWKELRSPEMRKGLGVFITFMKNLSQNNSK